MRESSIVILRENDVVPINRSKAKTNTKEKVREIKAVKPASGPSIRGYIPRTFAFVVVVNNSRTEVITPPISTTSSRGNYDAPN